MATLFGRTYSKQQLLELVGDVSQVASIRRAELTEGNERGAGLVEISNASGLSFSSEECSPDAIRGPTRRRSSSEFL